jgi:hypothetical protein
VGGDGGASSTRARSASPGDLYEQAVAVVLRDKKASTSYIQRRLQIGYNRAASLIERMEQEGIVGPANHAGKREILYEPPSNFRVTSDGSSVVMENRRLETADMYSLSSTPLKLILDDRIDLSGGRVQQVIEDDDLTTIKIVDRTLFGDSVITMMFDPQSYDLRQWTITDGQGRDTTVMIFNVEQGVRFDPSIFRINYQRVNEMNAPNR